MTVINTSPAIHLHAVLPGGLGALARLVGDVVVPYEVTVELAAGREKDATWLEIQAVPGLLLEEEPVVIHPLLTAQLDLGEAAVIQTALDRSCDTVVLDDLKARRVAHTLGLKVTGTLGILVLAKGAGELPSVCLAINALKQRGMWIEPALFEKALHLAGE